MTPAHSALFVLQRRDDTIPLRLASSDGFRPAWLLTPFAENTWKVIDTGHKPPRIIRFDIGLPDGTRLIDRSNFIESIKRIVFGIRHGPLLRVESGAVQAEKAGSLLTLVRWMVINRIDRFEDLTVSDQWEYSQLAAGGVHEILNTEGRLSSHLQLLAKRATFSIDDTPKSRRAKSLRALPVRRYRATHVFLDRERLMSDAGLDGVSLMSASGALSQLVDDFELASGLDVTQFVRRRASARVCVDQADERPVTTETVRRLLMPFVLLYEHRRYLDDAVRAPPFQGQALKDVAKRLGSDIGRTPTIPIAQAATLIERSIRWVLDYSPLILDAKDALDAGQALPASADSFLSAPATPFPLRPGFQNERISHPEFGTASPVVRGVGMTLPAALSYLAVACGTVIAAFSARRAAEIVGLQENCIVRDDAGNPWLRSFIHKTLQSDGTVPVPEVVASAVATLERLSARARMINASRYLFQFNLPGGDVIVGMGRDGSPIFQLSTRLREFGYFVDVPALPDGSRWSFRPHQFRRFFAVLYVWFYDLADWGALAYHLRHFNLEMTRRYVSDPELGAIINQANRQRTAEILSNVALGSQQLSGLGGKRLEQAVQGLYTRLAQRIQVVPERKLQQRIMRLVERTKLDLRALPWGYCASPAVQGLSAVCTGNSGPAAPSAATISTCSRCDRNVRTPEFKPYLEAALAQHRKVAEAAGTVPLLRRASETLCGELTEYLQSLPPASADQELLP